MAQKINPVTIVVLMPEPVKQLLGANPPATAPDVQQQTGLSRRCSFQPACRVVTG
jgi:hypothetical protein